MQDANNGDAVRCNAKINHMPTDIISAITWPDMIAIIGEALKSARAAVSISM